MKLLLQFMVTAVMITVATANPREVSFKKKIAELKRHNMQHFMTTNNFTCHTPQPRLVKVEEFHNKLPHMIYTPYATVLHRCAFDTGCCDGSESTCQPVDQNEVSLVFQVLDTISKTQDKISLQFYNHTMCGCSNHHKTRASGTVASRFHEGIFERKPADLEHQRIQHMMTVKNFTCNNPQPRLVGVEEFHTKKPHLVYTPDATVLHRCRFDTGSCFGHESTCQAIEQKEVNLVFHVYNPISESIDWIVLKAYNDTLCGCTNKVTYQVRSTKSLESKDFVTPTKAKEIKDNDKGNAQNKAMPSTRIIVLMLMSLLFFAL
ncbi:hypothetical protein C0J52_09204 [Blattella germanica]|nr:hypothetical protein C0J52_09204 [Blattella germanica]